MEKSVAIEYSESETELLENEERERIREEFREHKRCAIHGDTRLEGTGCPEYYQEWAAEISHARLQPLLLTLVALLLTGALYAQDAKSGHSATAGAYSSQGQATGGGQSGPLTYSARTDMAVFGTGATGELLPAACAGNAACLANAYNSSATTGHQGAALSYTGSQTQAPPAAGHGTPSGTNINGLNSYLSGANSSAMPAIDPDFGTQLYRGTDASMASATCLGGGGFGVSFSVGSSGDGHIWAADESKLIILNTGGNGDI